MAHHPEERMKPHDTSLGERARELLVAARAHQGIIARREIEEGGPLVLVGAFERTGPEWGQALDELVHKGLVVYKRGSMESEEVYEAI
jgi:hypothetical protein